MVTHNTNNKKPSYDDFLEFRAIILKAIAKCWNDQSAKTFFENDPKGALKEFFNYEYPFNSSITVDKDSAEYRPNLAGNWKANQFSSITLVLPPAPPEEERAAALAALNELHLTICS